MQLTISDLMALPIMKNAKVKAGKHVLSERLVEWVSVIEIPVENFIRQNELVLSTAIGCGHDPEALLQFIHDVYESGASALAIALGRHVFDIPNEVVQFAEKMNFILIELPWEIRFSDISQTCTNRIHELQREELKRSGEVQQRLLELVLHGGGPSDVARFVSEEIKQPVIITDQNGFIIGKGKCSKELLNLWNQALSTINIAKPEEKNQKNQHPLYTKFEFMNLAGKQHVLKIKIQSPGNNQGYLIVFLSNGEIQLTQHQINVIEHAATASAFSFLKENVREETEMRLKDDFIWDLATGEITTNTRVQSRAKTLGINLSLSYICITGRPENLEELYQTNQQGFISFKHWLESTIYYFEEEINYAGESVDRRILTTYQNNEMVIFLETIHNKSHETVNQFLDLVERRLNHLLPGLIISWGIAKYEDGVMKFKESFEKSRVALDMGKRQHGSGFRVHFEDTKINRLLLNLSGNEEVQTITISTIAPLLDYERQRQMDLIRTFTVYNKNNGNVSQTARELNLHRQSLLYRLRKIEALTGLSLVNPENVFLLEFSIKIWSIGLSKTAQFQ